MEYKKQVWELNVTDNYYGCTKCGKHCKAIYFNVYLSSYDENRWLCESCLDEMFPPIDWGEPEKYQLVRGDGEGFGFTCRSCKIHYSKYTDCWVGDASLCPDCYQQHVLKEPTPIYSKRRFENTEAMEDVDLENSNDYSNPITETTHSCVLQFPNGDIVEIPPPEADEHGGWESEIVFDGWTEVSEFDRGVWTSNYSQCGQKIRIYMESLGTNRHPYQSREFIHMDACLLIKEYHRFICTGVEVLSLTKHTRTYTPKPKTEDRYTELDKFPLLNGRVR